MEIPDSLLCLFTAETDQRGGSTVIKIPESEIKHGNVETDGVYQVALLTRADQPSISSGSEPSGSESDQPVQQGDVLEVEIEDIGEQGDGIARVGPGFVVIVPGTELGERATVEITDVSETVAFADIVNGDDPEL